MQILTLRRNIMLQRTTKGLQRYEYSSAILSTAAKRTPHIALGLNGNAPGHITAASFVINSDILVRFQQDTLFNIFASRHVPLA
jgi:hypothetical protein